MNNLLTLLRLFITLALTLLPVAWVHQQSLENFWLQRYHSPAPWLVASHLPAWQAGGRVQGAVVAAANSFWQELSGTAPVPLAKAAVPQDVVPAPLAADAINQADEPTRPSNEAAQHLHPPATALTTAVADPLVEAETPPEPQPVHKLKARLAQGQRMLFAGDSMMQGVAPHLVSRLRREHGIASIDLSRQSTGLTYPSAFNWPSTIEDTLKRNADIGVLAVFMGPNDPWDMPSGRGGPFLRFRSDDWEALYRQRIQHILHTAQHHQVDVIWIAPPLMRKPSLSEKVSYIGELYQQEVQAAGEVFLSSNQILGYLEGQYSDYPGDGQPRQKLRAGDGIHFTLAGQRLLANALYQYLQIEPAPEPELATTDSDPQP